ncbi:MAG TPA: sigma-70 family RNA polymerase sigma factor [Planctomycetes bacterium]|nr:sigma-70 family RNA polymerase sigma factor [Planctomycetota bacterium]
MPNDKILIRKVKHGCKDSMRRIYQRYKDDLLTLARALSNDKTLAEDVVHDVFVSFAESVGKLQLRKSLKVYLAASVRNTVNDRLRTRKRHTAKEKEFVPTQTQPISPDRLAAEKETIQLLRQALIQLPFEQREAVLLHIQSGLTFKQIAALQNVSTNTVQGRFRYGLEKLRALLDGEVINETDK